MAEHDRRLQIGKLSLRVQPIFLVLALVGCASGDLSDLQKYVTEVKSRQKGAIEPLPEVKTVEPFVFHAEDLRDPFVLDERTEELEAAKVASAIRPDTTRPKEELESYELDSLRMVGTVDMEGVLWGLVKASDNTIHRIRSGNYMGRNYGKVVTIKENQIELIELVADNPGQWRERKAALDLAEATGGNR